MGYAKLFSSITESSLWSEPKEVRLLFVSMLARADQTGFVEASVPGLARLANLAMGEVEPALAVLEAPDPYSKNPANDGRRILKVPGGWVMLNYEDYRNRRDDDRREYMREYMRTYRQKTEQDDPVNKSANAVNKNVYAVSKNANCKPQAEAEHSKQKAEAESEQACKHANGDPGPDVVPAPESAGGGVLAVPAPDRDVALRNFRALVLATGPESPIGSRFHERAKEAMRVINQSGRDALGVVSDIIERSNGKPKAGAWALRALEGEAGIERKAKANAQ